MNTWRCALCDREIEFAPHVYPNGVGVEHAKAGSRQEVHMPGGIGAISFNCKSRRSWRLIKEGEEG